MIFICDMAIDMKAILDMIPMLAKMGPQSQEPSFQPFHAQVAYVNILVLM